MKIDSAFLKKALEVATEAANAGGVVMKHYWGNLASISEKSSQSDLVTEADRLSEIQIKKLLRNHFPEHAILAEESGIDKLKESDFLWAVDPLDGTTNYTHQFPMVAVSIGLLYQNQPVMGVVYNPITDELFQAAAGAGATLNGKPIHVSTTAQLAKSLLATGFAYDRQETRDNNYPEFSYLTNRSQGVRRLGAASLDLAFVACGRLDGYWERGLQLWDMAAGIALVLEAGGMISAYDKSPFKWESGRILATNGKIHLPLSAALAEATKKS